MLTSSKSQRQPPCSIAFCIICHINIRIILYLLTRLSEAICMVLRYILFFKRIYIIRISRLKIAKI